jgi:hypothetical protein
MYNYHAGDDRLRRKRLVPECEPRGTDLVNSVQTIKCQSHSICCSPARCLSEQEAHSSLREMTSATPDFRPVCESGVTKLECRI